MTVTAITLAMHMPSARAEAIASIQVNRYQGVPGTELTSHGVGDYYAEYSPLGFRAHDVLTLTLDGYNIIGALRSAVVAGIEISTYLAILQGPFAEGLIQSMFPLGGAREAYWAVSNFKDPTIITAPMSKTLSFINSFDWFNDSWMFDEASLYLRQNDPEDKVEIHFMISTGDWLDDTRADVSAPVPEAPVTLVDGWTRRVRESEDGYPQMEILKRSYLHEVGGPYHWVAEIKLVLYPKRLPLTNGQFIQFSAKEKDCWHCIGATHVIRYWIENDCTAEGMVTRPDGSCEACLGNTSFDPQVNACVECPEGSYVAADGSGTCIACTGGQVVDYINLGLLTIGQCLTCEDGHVPDPTHTMCVPTFCRVAYLGYPQSTDTRWAGEWYGRARCSSMFNGRGEFLGVYWEHDCGPNEYIDHETCGTCGTGEHATGGGHGCEPDVQSPIWWNLYFPTWNFYWTAFPWTGETCAAGELGCDDGTCIPDSWVCDGTYVDCPYGEDEDPALCGGGTTCAAGEVSCDDGTCIPDSWVCDGTYVDCPYGEDERGCS